jgi:hypothetical protein
MIRLYAPVAVAVVAILGFTAWEAVLQDRFTTSSVTAEEFGERFKNVPDRIGEWIGQDNPVKAEVLEQAGAVRYVSRLYTNPRTKQTVDVWLIVGHARDICRHTPNICYPNQGFSQLGSIIKHTIEPPADAEHPGTFYTAKFRNESQLGTKTVRVFWAWNGNVEGLDEWEAPDDQKQRYGNNTALYKLYFTAPMSDDGEETGKNVAVEFGKLALPYINRALFPDRYKDLPLPEDENAATAADPLAPIQAADLEAPAAAAPAAEDAAAGDAADGEPAPAAAAGN